MEPITMAMMAASTISSLFGASKGADAAKDAAATQAAAADRSAQMQYQIYQQQRADQEPWRATGGAALNTLNSRFGLPQYTPTTPAPDQLTQAYGGGGGGGSLTAAQHGAAARYLQEHPDVLAEYNRLSPNNLKNNLGVETPEEFAAWHYQAHGKGSGWTWGDPAAQTSSPSVGVPGNETKTPDPAVGTSPASAYAYDPTVANTGGYAVQARQEFRPLDVSADAYQESPGYAYRVQQGLKAVNAGMSATGGLGSGRRLMALQDRGDNLANQDYEAWRSYTTGQYNTDRARSDAIYDADRAYTSGRYDTNTNQLMSMAGLGQTANSQNASSASSFANAYGQALTGAANASAAGQINSANAWNNGLNNIMQTGAYLYGQGAFGGGSKAPTYKPVTDAYSGVY